MTWAAAEILTVNRQARRSGADVVWSPANFAPITRSSTARVTTTHDVTYHAAGKGIVGRLTSWLMARAALTSDAVITGSRAAESAVVSHIGVRRDLITVIPHGTTSSQAPADPWSELAPLGISRSRRIVLSTGNRLAHKNFEGLLRAMAEIREDRPVLILPGSHSSDPLAPLVEDLGLSDDVILPGWVTSDQLESLFAVASLYVCPSLAEGFGLPVLDAMRRGCVVLANDVEVLREVGGDVAIYADATSPVQLSSAIQSALSVDQTARRRAGEDRGAEFTWERSAAATAEVLASAAAPVRGRS